MQLNKKYTGYKCYPLYHQDIAQIKLAMTSKVKQKRESGGEQNMKQIVKKIITTLLTLVIVSFLLFLAFELIPGDPARAKLGTDATPEQLAALRAQMGLNRPLMERYVTWLFAFFTGDFGTSYSYSMPVREMILDKLPITVTLTVMAFFLMIVISVPLAVFMAKHEGGIADSVFSGLNQVIMAVPSFFSGILLTLVFGVVLKLFVPGDFVSYDVNAGKFFAYLFFPAVAIALPKTAMAVKMLRSSLLAEMKHDYVRTAYSRGNDISGVLYRACVKKRVPSGSDLLWNGACRHLYGKYCCGESV